MAAGHTYTISYPRAANLDAPAAVVTTPAITDDVVVSIKDSLTMEQKLELLEVVRRAVINS